MESPDFEARLTSPRNWLIIRQLPPAAPLPPKTDPDHATADSNKQGVVTISQVAEFILAITGLKLMGSELSRKRVWAVKDSNLRPTGYEPAALTT